jgi:Uma2 family endonuclease
MGLGCGPSVIVSTRTEPNRREGRGVEPSKLWLTSITQTSLSQAARKWFRQGVFDDDLPKLPAHIARCSLASPHLPSVRFVEATSDVHSPMTHRAALHQGVTVEEFFALDLADGKAELVRGEVRMTPPPGGPHAVVQSNVVAALVLHVAHHRSGRVFTDGTAYELVSLPRTVRVPDASFVRSGRLPAGGVGPGVLRMAPDLAVEILSPDDTASEVEERLDDYAAGGTPVVWVIDPIRRTVMIVDADGPARWVHAGDVLEGGSVLPGFSCHVSALFEGVAIG